MYSYTIGITLLFIFLLIALYESLYYYSEWKRAYIEAEEMKRINIQVQMDTLKVQIQPHFLFNSLNTLIGLLEADKMRAISFTQELASVYHYILKAKEHTLIDLQEEIRFANSYFLLLRTRYPEELQVVIEAGSASEFDVPPLCLQILLENAVKHNIITKAKPLQVYVYLDSRHQQVIVQNNYQPKPQGAKNGYGLEYLRKQFRLLGLPLLSIQSTGQEFIVKIPVVKKQTIKTHTA